VAHVRFVHAAEAAPLRLLFGETPLVEGLARGSATPFLPLAPSSNDVRVLIGESPDVLAAFSFGFLADTWVTFYVTGSQAENSLRLDFWEEARQTPLDTLRVHVINTLERAEVVSAGQRQAAPPNRVLSLDVPLAEIGSAFSLEAEGQSIFPFRERPPLPLQSYILTLFQAGGQVRWAARSAPLYAAVRVEHLANAVPFVDIALNGETLIRGLSFPNSDGFQLINGAYAISLNAFDPDTGIFTPLYERSAPTLLALDTSLTFQLTGDPNANNLRLETSLQTLSEALAPWQESAAVLAGDNAYVVLRHLLPEVGAVRVLSEEGAVWLEGLTFRGEAGILDLPSGTYSLQVVAEDAPATALLTPQATVLAGGTLYEWRLVGTAEAPLLQTMGRCVAHRGCPSGTE
jgi:hypothetical protein